MTKLVQGLLIPLLVLTPTAAKAGAIEDAEAVVDHWATAFNSNDAETLVGLYAPDAMLFGMLSSGFTEGSDPIRAYVTSVLGRGSKIEIGDRRVMALSPSAVLSTGFYQLVVKRDGRPSSIPARFTILLVKHGNDWLIAHQHVSPRPEPPR